MGFWDKLENFGREAEKIGIKIAKPVEAVLGPDLQAWGDVVTGRATASDYFSAGTDLATLIPGGMFARGLARIGGEAVKHVDELNALRKWESNPLYHSTKNDIKGNQLLPLGGGHAKSTLLSSHYPAGRVTQDVEVNGAEVLRGGKGYDPEEYYKAREGKLIRSGQMIQPTAPTNHGLHSFATPTESLARGLMTHMADGEKNQLLHVVPLSKPRDVKLIHNPMNRRDAIEVLDKKGFRIVGGDDQTVVHPTREDWQAYIFGGKSNSYKRGMWKSTDATKAALEEAIRKDAPRIAGALPAWAALSNVDELAREDN